MSIIIYKATNIGDNPENGKSYIGFSKHTLEKRKRQHYISKKLEIFHKAIRQWGIESFSWKVLSVVENSMKGSTEKKAIKVYNTLSPNGYNSTTGGEGGYELSEETRRKLSERQMGKKNHRFGKHLSDETKQKISKALIGENSPFFGKIGEDAPNFGNHHTEETRRKLSDFNKGKHLSDETKQKISKALIGENSPLFGKHPSNETIRKMSESHKGENNAMFGKHQSEETKEKQSKANMGKKHSNESIRKMSNSAKGENNSANKYHYFCSDDKDYWKDFTKNERINICRKFREKNSDTIMFHNITINRKLK